MRKYLFVFVLLSTFLIASPANAQTNSDKEAIKELNNRITEIEEEIEELSNVDELKSEMNDSLLNREKDIADSLYNFLLVFIGVVTLFVTVIGTALSIFASRVQKREKEIEAILNSQEFNEKVNAIEQRLEDLRMKERLSNFSSAKREFMLSEHQISKLIEIVKRMRDYRIPGPPTLEEILGENHWDDLITDFYKLLKESIGLLEQDIKPEDDKNENMNIEEQLIASNQELKDLEKKFREVFEKVMKEVR